AARQAAQAQRMCELHAARAQLGIAAAERAVDDGDMLGKDRRAALQEEQRRERLVVGGNPGKGVVVGGGHGVQRSCQCGARLPRKAPMPSSASAAIMFSTITALAAS